MNSKLLRLLTFFAFLTQFMPSLIAQTPDCQFTIIMADSGGDGWNGGKINITSGALSTQFTLSAGAADTMTFDIYDGQPLSFAWVQGIFIFQVSYKILNNVGEVISERQAPNMPNTSILYSGIGKCVTCTKPLNFRVDGVWDTYAKFRWSANPVSPNPATQWRVIYGPQGFDVAAGAGDTATTAIPKITLTGLQKKTWYDAYIEQNCGVTGDWSDRVGPISFQTSWTKDVGITGLVSPVSACDLGTADTVRILLRNYGAAPQTIIPMRFTVNGQDVGIPKPDDGVYSDVLGKDSTEVFTFETTYDFSDPGEYKIVAYTKFIGDEDLSNDTFTYFVNNHLLSPYQQSFEVWDGGFTVSADFGTPNFVFGTPDKPGIPGAANGENAWVTYLTGNYGENELSYLESPCFDFSSLTVDPAITFSIAHDLESTYDAAWLEISVNGGNTWTKVGAIGEGINWYNQDIIEGTEAGESWSGSSGGWVKARHFLTGAAGQSEVHFRFVFASDITVQFGGLGVDDIRIFPAFNKDLAGRSVVIASENDVCGLQNEPVTFTFTNVGSQTQSGFQVAYSVNGGAPIIETVTSAITPDHSRSYTFNATFDSRDVLSVIKCWTILAFEFAPANDSATFTIDHRPLPTPFQENFEGQQIPQGWTSDGFVTNMHGNTSYVLAVNMYTFNPESIHELPRYGLIGANDSLEYSYRITDFINGGPIVLALGTKFELQASTDCGATYQTLNTINSLNSSPSTSLRKRKVSLAQYSGQSISIRIKSTWTAGDFWFDIDNVNLLACAADMALSADVTGATSGQSDGAATVNVGLGNPPYTYLWSNGAITQTVGNLAVGTYTVMVSDAYGCSDSFEFGLGLSVTEEIEALSSFSLRPNPASGEASFIAEFDQVVGDARFQLINLLGQSVWETYTSNATLFSGKIDLTQLPAGLYLARLMVDGRVATKKLIKQ